MTMQKLPRVIAEAAAIEPTGTFRVRIGEGGRVTAIPYTTEESDGRIVFNSQAWREFHSGRSMEVGQAVVITLSKCHSDIVNVSLMINYL